jgi:hypothetical protein
MALAPTVLHGARPKSSGFTLFIAIIFALVLTSIGAVLSSFALKETTLSAAAVQSQYAFYAADTALECALYADQQGLAFDYANEGVAKTMTCDGVTINIPAAATCYNGSTGSCQANYREIRLSSIAIDGGARCASLDIFKPSGFGPSYIFAQGYNVSCATINTNSAAVIRGLEATY